MKEKREVGLTLAPYLALSRDLSALLTADEVGLALLRSLRDSGAALSGASRFLQLLIEGTPGTRSGGRRAR